MIKTIFETEGTLELEALTILGLSAKPATTSPIGMFGTGLKYAVAVLCRLNIKIEIYAGGKHWQVSTQDAGFRGAAYEAILMKNLNDPYETVQLPFTTQLGKNWELWAVLRELECNTIDEQGSSYQENGEQIIPLPNRTYIVVYGDEFAELFGNRFKSVFIDNAVVIRHQDEGVQIIDSPSDYLFYRGVRVMKLPKTALFTYNVLSPVRLTEDRTVAESEMLYVCGYVRTALKQAKDTDLLERVLNCSEQEWENDIGFLIAVWNKDEFSSEFKNIGATCSRKAISKGLYEISPAYLQSKEELKEKARNQHFLRTLIDCIETDEWDKFRTVAESHSGELAIVLNNALEEVQE